MKPFKRKLEFRLFGIHVVLSFSTYRYGYKRGEKKEQAPDADQLDLFMSTDGRGNEVLKSAKEIIKEIRQYNYAPEEHCVVTDKTGEIVGVR